MVLLASHYLFALAFQNLLNNVPALRFKFNNSILGSTCIDSLLHRYVYSSTRSVPNKAPFSSENFWLLATVVLSFVFGKNCPIMDYLGLKDSSRQLQANCAISYSFYLHLMLHACAARFDMTGNLENFWFLACN